MVMAMIAIYSGQWLTGDIMITSREMSMGDEGQFDKERLLYGNQGKKERKRINPMNDSVFDNIFGFFGRPVCYCRCERRIKL